MSLRPRAALLKGICLALFLLPLLGVACREEPTPLPPLREDEKPVAMIPLATYTPRATEAIEEAEESTQDEPGTESEDGVESAESVTTTLTVGLPLDLEAPIVQFARIEPSPWEPELLGSMHPNFSMQANGRIFYSFPGGSSLDGWYQTALTPTLALGLVETLWNEVGIAELAEELEPPELVYETALDGRAAGTGTIGVVYVNSTAGSARLVISEDSLENPSGPYAARIKRLHNIIIALQYWRNYTDADSPELVRQGVEATLGWWVEQRASASITDLLAFGTAARGYLPDDAADVSWPLQGAADTPLAELVTAGFGGAPDELALSGDDAILAWRGARQRKAGFWGPLWTDYAGDRYLIGLRPSIPGGNHAVVEYSYTVPKRGMTPAGGDE